MRPHWGWCGLRPCGLNAPGHPTHPGDSCMKRSDKDQPLIDDIRLLGRILGDVIREQEGVEAYELVEQVRKPVSYTHLRAHET